MPFGPTGIYVGKLNSATPTPFDENDLKTQLQNIGLSCAQLTPETLRNYIADVNSQLPSGSVQSFGIKAPNGSPTLAAIGVPARKIAQSRNVLSLAAKVPPLTDVATGNWTTSTTAEGYAPHLEIIQFPAHFDWLYQNRATNGFTGVKDDPPAYTGNYQNADAIKNLFVNVCLTASATLVKGLDQSTMQATLSNVISPLQDSQLSNYDVTDSRAIFLVDNYNPQTGYADGVGVVSVGWHLTIQDWQRKSKDGGDTHPTSLTINASAVLYSDPSILCPDYNAVLKQFGISPGTAPVCPISS